MITTVTRLLAFAALLFLAAGLPACRGYESQDEATAVPPATSEADAPAADTSAMAHELSAATDEAAGDTVVDVAAALDAAGLYALAPNSLAGQPAPLAAYAGKVSLVVNVASKCGYTPQYAGLQALSEEFADRGLVVLAFPSNEFGGQEPGSPAQIAAFCSDEYGVSFPMFEKCEVKDGPGQSPVYSLLQEQTGSAPNRNFCKYLVARDGSTLGFYPSKIGPDSEDLRAAIVAALD